jgi:hypothetical protein
MRLLGLHRRRIAADDHGSFCARSAHGNSVEKKRPGPHPTQLDSVHTVRKADS